MLRPGGSLDQPPLINGWLIKRVWRHGPDLEVHDCRHELQRKVSRPQRAISRHRPCTSNVKAKACNLPVATPDHEVACCSLCKPHRAEFADALDELLSTPQSHVCLQRFDCSPVQPRDGAMVRAPHTLQGALCSTTSEFDLYSQVAHTRTHLCLLSHTWET